MRSGIEMTFTVEPYKSFLLLNVCINLSGRYNFQYYFMFRPSYISNAMYAKQFEPRPGPNTLLHVVCTTYTFTTKLNLQKNRSIL